jgi:hypothetical protein
VRKQFIGPLAGVNRGRSRPALAEVGVLLLTRPWQGALTRPGSLARWQRSRGCRRRGPAVGVLRVAAGAAGAA